MRAKSPETADDGGAEFAGFRGCSRGLGPHRDRSNGRNGPQKDHKRIGYRGWSDLLSRLYCAL